MPLLGRPMILWVAALSEAAVGRDRVFIATDDERIRTAVERGGYRVIMTDPGASTGTDRIAQAATALDFPIIVNVQGDEPLLDPADIVHCIELKRSCPGDIVNAYCEIGPGEDPTNVNIPKVVVSESGYLLYMSRSLVPGAKESARAPKRYLKQVCIYGFGKDDLKAFRGFGRKCEVERSEDIEILRFLELGRRVRMFEASTGSLAVDVPSDVAGVEQALRFRAERR